MYSGVRFVLILLATAVVLAAGWFAASAISANVTTLRHWQRSEGTLVSMPARDFIEVELGQEPDTRRVIATADHMVGLTLFHHTAVYTDPSDSKHVRLGAFLQLWLWPAALVAIAAVCVLALAGTLMIGRGIAAEEAVAAGRWNFSPQPPLPESAIMLHPPQSAGMTPFSRLGPILAGSVLMLGTWALALNNYTLLICADANGLRANSALGWRVVRWDLVKGVERRELYTEQKRFGRSSLAWPGSSTQSIAFTGANGVTLLRMSTHMQPAEGVNRFFDLCAAHTGLREQFRRVAVPDL